MDVRDIDTRYLRSKTGYVPQDIFLFSGTVAENISLHHPDATLDEIMAAAKKAGAHEFIDRLPKRYETVLGEHMTVIIIAHRLTTVMNCDSIFVMEQGKVVQHGTHRELLARDGLYKEMWQGIRV